jgi:uncharacterized protein involved in cysteine biosynthesis
MVRGKVLLRMHMHAIELAGRTGRARQLARKVLEGLTLPLQAAKLLVADRELLNQALKPVVWLAFACAVVAVLTALPPFGWLRRFYQVFAALAPLPSILFASEYGRLAAEVRRRATGLPAEPHEEPFAQSLARLIKQVVLTAAAIAPLTLLLHLLPGIGPLLAKLLVAGWALHWVVVNALENARVRDERGDEAAPWFVRGARETGRRVPLLAPATHFWAALCNALSRPWRKELLVIERHPALIAGFAITTAVLLCTPVLNLFFRPVVVAAAALLLARTSPLRTSSSDPA